MNQSQQLIIIRENRKVDRVTPPPQDLPLLTWAPSFQKANAKSTTMNPRRWFTGAWNRQFWLNSTLIKSNRVDSLILFFLSINSVHTLHWRSAWQSGPPLWCFGAQRGRFGRTHSLVQRRRTGSDLHAGRTQRFVWIVPLCFWMKLLHRFELGKLEA